MIVPSWYNSPKAPARGEFVRQQAIELARRGHFVSVIVIDRDAKGELLSVSIRDEDAIPHYRIAAPWPWHRILGFYGPQIIAGRVKSLIRSVGADLVHAHAVRPAGVVSALAAGALDLPMCLTEHSGPLDTFWTTMHGRRQIASAYAAADRLFAVSISLQSAMKRLFPFEAANTEVLHNGVDVDRFRPVAPCEFGARLLFVGSLEHVKGVHSLFEAVARLPEQIDWRLTIVGQGPLRESLAAQAGALGIAHRLHWKGMVRNTDLPAIFAAHDLLVVSSLTETFSLVSAEALASGLPVVATACGGPEEVIGPLGLPLVEPNNPLALSNAIETMLAKLPDFDRFAAAASIEQRFSMRVLGDRLEAVYGDMCRDPS